MSTADEGQEPDTMLDVPKEFHEVVRKHGREMYALVMNAGMSGGAALVLARVLGKSHSTHGLHAAGVLLQGFGQVSNAYAAKMGWTQEQLAECDRDLQMAFRGKVVVPGAALILDS